MYSFHLVNPHMIFVISYNHPRTHSIINISNIFWILCTPMSCISVRLCHIFVANISIECLRIYCHVSKYHSFFHRSSFIRFIIYVFCSNALCFVHHFISNRYHILFHFVKFFHFFIFFIYFFIRQGCKKGSIC